MSPEKRKLSSAFLIDRPLVKKYLILVSMILLISTLIVGLVIHQTIKGSMEKELKRVQKISVYDVLIEVNNTMLLRVFGVLLAAIIVTAFAGVIFLHKIIGPLYRIRKVLSELREGKLEHKKVKLRKGDFLEDLAEEMNQLIGKISP